MEDIVYRLFGWNSDKWADIKDATICYSILLTVVFALFIPWVVGWIIILRTILF